VSVLVDETLNLGAEITGHPHRFSAHPGVVGAIGSTHQRSLPQSATGTFDIRTKTLV